MSVIEKDSGRRLTEDMKSIADEYSADVLGSRRYAPWLYVYILINGDFQEGWIPDNFFGRSIVPAINKKLRVLGEFKSFTNAVLRTDMLPDIGYHMDGVWYDRDLSVRSMSELRRSISKDHDSVFVKLDGSEQGKGVRKWPLSQLSEKHVKDLGNCVLQSPIVQHQFLEKMNSDSVQTIRVTTVRNNSGSIEARAAYLRIGRKGSAWVRSAEAVKVAIVNDGCLSPFGFMPDWSRRERHPDTGFVFEGKHLPHFGKAREVCIGLHGKVPHLAIIGWDVTIDRDEQVRIIEWNTNHSDIKFSEATTGPCFLGLGWEKYGCT